jgi:hypothetical protein
MSQKKTCDFFCKEDYLPAMDKVFKKYDASYKRSKNAINVCKKTFCNKKCRGYNAYISKKNKSGFQKTYTKAQIQTLKNRGALSGCVNIADYAV